MRPADILIELLKSPAHGRLSAPGRPDDDKPKRELFDGLFHLFFDAVRLVGRFWIPHFLKVKLGSGNVVIAIRI